MKSVVQIVEVGPRDGLQNEKKVFTLHQKYDLIKRLSLAGLERIEIGAFVSKDWVPQMSDSTELVKKVLAAQASGELPAKIRYSTLAPNLKGMELAVQSGIKEVAIFGASTETFSKKNINCSIAESFVRFRQVMDLAKPNKIKVRGYLSMAFGCPFEGKVDESRVVRLVRAMLKLGVHEVSIGDTIGVATPAQVESLLKKIKKIAPLTRIAMHFHDTRGTALANVLASYRMGIRVFDSSVGGLGGCPYAKNATGNLATEDLMYMLNGMNVKFAGDVSALIDMRSWIQSTVDHELPAKVSKAGLPLKGTL
ncbi:MAG: hydroxymethylglutaryl-CoA lyase [Bdellovibrionota bacterium]